VPDVAHLQSGRQLRHAIPQARTSFWQSRSWNMTAQFPEPAGAVQSALDLVAQLPEAGLPPAHVGVAAGPVVIQGGDYFGRTVNLAARIATRAGPGQVLVSQRVAGSAASEDVRFMAWGEPRLKGIGRPVRLLEGRRA
jgi:adenylate cyclase